MLPRVLVKGQGVDYVALLPTSPRGERRSERVKHSIGFFGEERAQEAGRMGILFASTKTHPCPMELTVGHHCEDWTVVLRPLKHF